jgi:RNA polymerase primary sigma factor
MSQLPTKPEIVVNPHDPLKLYLTEIGAVPLMTEDEERDLAIYIRRKKRSKIVIGGTEIVGYEQARNYFVQANLRLVVSVAKQYKHIVRSLTFEDLIQEGNIGLMTAIDKYDPFMGNRFSTYATWWIRQAVLRSIPDKNYIIRKPVHLHEQILKYKKVYKMLASEFQREPMDEEVATEMGVDIEKVRSLASLQETVGSLDVTIGEDESPMWQLIADPSHEQTWKQADARLLQEFVKEILGELDKRERLIIEMRCGFKDGTAYTLEAIGEKCGVTRERIRQIQEKVTERIKEKHMKKLWLFHVS